MYFSSYGPLKFTIKSTQNAKFPVNHTLRQNNSNLIMDSDTVLTFNNYKGEMNSEGISRRQVQSPIKTWSALKIAHRRTCSMFEILFLDECYLMETEALKFFIAS